MVRRAIERILGDPRSERFNAMEITRVTSLDSQRFPVVHYVSVSAHSRHIQESLILFSAKDPQRRQQGAAERNNDTGQHGTDLESLID
jgi:hypothetical protein